MAKINICFTFNSKNSALNPTPTCCRRASCFLFSLFLHVCRTGGKGKGTLYQSSIGTGWEERPCVDVRFCMYSMNVKPRRVLNRLDFSICSRGPEVQSGDEIWGTFLQDLATGGLLGRWRPVPTGTERIPWRVPEKVVTAIVTCAVTLQKVPVCPW